ncbi:MAG: hypothetical protein ACOCP4_00145 [Candidatus Woesearchaeota archaeon]
MAYSKEEVLAKAKVFGENLSEIKENLSEEEFLELLLDCNEIISKQTEIDYARSVNSGNSCNGSC